MQLWQNISSPSPPPLFSSSYVCSSALLHSTKDSVVKAEVMDVDVIDGGGGAAADDDGCCYCDDDCIDTIFVYNLVCECVCL